jgi:hypothetical protein
VGAQTFTVLADELADVARAELWLDSGCSGRKAGTDRPVLAHQPRLAGARQHPVDGFVVAGV